MASFFYNQREQWELLDAGAGKGSLTAALVRQVCTAKKKPSSIKVTAYEIDKDLIPQLFDTLAECKKECDKVGISFTSEVYNKNFLKEAVKIIQGKRPTTQFNTAIVNPPYKKIRSNSTTRPLLRSIGIETSNLYAAFLALIIRLLAPNGELVAITPRSFCNGPYFKPFRKDFLKNMSLRRLHVFESRSAAFSESDILQENIIFHAFKNTSKPERVIISSSSGKPNATATIHQVPYRKVVVPEDSEKFIHLIVDDANIRANSLISRLSTTLPKLELSVSTGRVVDFRAEAFIRRKPGNNTVPLIYPCHFNSGYVHWPRLDSRKPNAIVDSQKTHHLLVPAGNYVLVKRFSPKEEKRRVVACIYNPRRIRSRFIGFENHLNFFHNNGRGLSLRLAKGLAAFLNSTVLDTYFRQFSGHTQVNATDLRNLKYPPKNTLKRIGSRIDITEWQQSNIDKLVEKEVFSDQSKHGQIIRK